MAYELHKVVCYDCVARHHLVSRCPRCDDGVILSTCSDDFKGIVETPCSDCGEQVAFYVLMKERKAWMLSEPVEVTSPQPAKKAPGQEA